MAGYHGAGAGTARITHRETRLSMYNFRRARNESSEQLARLWVDTFTQAYGGMHSPQNIRAFCAGNYTLDAAQAVLSSDQVYCCIATKNGKPSGFYIVRHHECPIMLDGESSELKQIYVLASEYGTGLGMSLLENASGVVRDAGRQWLWLCVADTNTRGQAFYRKHDFVSVGSGPTLEVGTDCLSSTIVACRL